MAQKNFMYNIRRLLQNIALKFTSHEFMSKIYFRIVLHEKLDLENPKTFNEKIQWMKLYYFPKSSLVIKCTDKYSVRKYMEEKGQDEYLNELIGVWDDVDDIDWNDLPNKFVIKCNHGCGYNIICDDKSKLNVDKEKKKLKKWMKEDFALFNAEPHYSKISRKIICEKHLGSNIIDYKFFCFNGKPEFMYVAMGMGKGENEQVAFFDMNGNRAPFKRIDYDELKGDFKMPNSFSEMVKISMILAKEFPFVRVDLFDVEGKIYLSELTFTPSAALMPFSPKKYDRILGELIDINKLQKD